MSQDLTKLREIFEKHIEPVPTGVFWTTANEYGTHKMDAQSCIIYRASYQTFLKTAEYYEKLLAEARAVVPHGVMGTRNYYCEGKLDGFDDAKRHINAALDRLIAELKAKEKTE